MSKLHPIFEQALAPFLKPVATRNDEPLPDHDPTPYCAHCNATRRQDCHCGPIPEND